METYLFTLIWYEYNILKAVTVNLSHPQLLFKSLLFIFERNVLFIYLFNGLKLFYKTDWLVPVLHADWSKVTSKTCLMS